MNEIKPIFDNRPVYFGSDGFPLLYGKLKFFAIGTSNPKEVYSDYERTTSSGSVVLLNNVGRSDTQLFTGEGDYTVHAYKFNGTDPLTAEENEWSLDNQWVQNGCRSVISNGATLAIVNNISELRDLDQTVNTTALLLGYYNAGDKQPIIYRLKTNSDSDNGGTIIKNPMISNKSWVYNPESETVNASIFGLIPNDTAFKNSFIASACAYCYATNKTLYIPKGLYYFEPGYLTVNCDISIDDGVSFRCDLGNYQINIYKNFDIRLTNDIKNSMSTGNVFFQFQKNSYGNYIDASWFGAIYDNSTNCGSSLILMVDNIANNLIPIRISGAARITSISKDLMFKNDIVFYSEGYFRNSQTECEIIFNNIKLFNDSPIKNKCYCIYLENLSKFRMKDMQSINASLFEDPNEIGGTRRTLDLSRYLNEMQHEGTKTKFVIDVPICRFLTAANCASYDLVCDGGVISIYGTNIVKFNSVLNPDYGYFISSGIFVSLNGETKYKWFKADEATTAQQTISWNLSILSASYGNGILNLDNESIPIGSTIANIPYTKGSANLEIKNGSISIDSTGYYFIPMNSSNYNTLKFKNVIFNSSIGIESGLINATNYTYIYNLYFDDCIFFSGLNAGSCKFINITDTSQIINLRIRNSVISSSSLIGGNLSGLNDSILENSNLVCDVSVNGTSGTNIENCNIGSNNINLYSKNGFLNGFVRGCTATTGSVNIFAVDKDTILSGLNVSNNSISNVTLGISGSGTFHASPESHSLLVENNKNSYGFAKCTRGYTKISDVYSNLREYNIGDVFFHAIGLPSEMLTDNLGHAGKTVWVGMPYSDYSSNEMVAKDFVLTCIKFGGPRGGYVDVGLRALAKGTYNATDVLAFNVYFESFRGV